MAFEDLFNATFTVQKSGGFNKRGRPNPFVPGDTGFCRLAPAEGELGRDGEGQDVVIDALIYMLASVDIEEKDQLDVDSVRYRVLQKKTHSRAKDAHHFRLGVRKVG